jgi:hypothetical protein
MRNDPHKDWDNLFNQLPLDTTLSVEQLEKVKRCALDAFENRPAP